MLAVATALAFVFPVAESARSEPAEFSEIARYLDVSVSAADAEIVSGYPVCLTVRFDAVGPAAAGLFLTRHRLAFEIRDEVGTVRFSGNPHGASGIGNTLSVILKPGDTLTLEILLNCFFPTIFEPGEYTVALYVIAGAQSLLTDEAVIRVREENPAAEAELYSDLYGEIVQENEPDRLEASLSWWFECTTRRKLLWSNSPASYAYKAELVRSGDIEEVRAFFDSYRMTPGPAAIAALQSVSNDSSMPSDLRQAATSIAAEIQAGGTRENLTMNRGFLTTGWRQRWSIKRPGAATAVWAGHSLKFGNSDRIVGNVGVRGESVPPLLSGEGAEVEISNGAVIEGNVFAHRVVMGNGARVEGVVAADELTTGAQSVVTLGWRSPVHLPVIDPFPNWPDFTAGGDSLEVKNNKTHQLLPGSYGAAELGDKSRLVLVGGGDYLFDSFEADNNAEVLVLTPARLLVSGRFSAGNGFTIQFPDTSDLTAEDCFLYIRGENADPADIRSRPAAVELGNNSTLRAHVVAPFGTIRTGNDLELQGAISGHAVDIGNGSSIVRE